MEDEQYDNQIRMSNLSEYLNQKRENANFQRWLLDDVQEVQYLQSALRGILFNPETGKDEEYKESRMMNDKGARILTETYLLPIEKNAKLSNFTEDEIKYLMNTNLRRLIRHLYQNLEDYEVEYDNLGLIYTLLETFLKSVFNRALFGAEQQRLITTQKVISQETIQDSRTNDPQKDDRRSIRDYIPMMGRH